MRHLGMKKTERSYREKSAFGPDGPCGPNTGLRVLCPGEILCLSKTIEREEEKLLKDRL